MEPLRLEECAFLVKKTPEMNVNQIKRDKEDTMISISVPETLYKETLLFCNIYVPNEDKT